MKFMDMQYLLRCELRLIWKILSKCLIFMYFCTWHAICAVWIAAK